MYEIGQMLPETGSGFEIGLIKPRNVSREYYAASRCITAATIDCIVTRIRQRNKEQSFDWKKARGKRRNVKTENGKNELDNIHRLDADGTDSKESPKTGGDSSTYGNGSRMRRGHFVRAIKPAGTWTRTLGILTALPGARLISAATEGEIS